VPNPPQGQQGAAYSITGPVDQATGANLERVASLFTLAEAGRPSYQCDLFDDLIGRDPSLYGLVHGRVSALAGKPVVVRPGGDKAQDRRAADALQEVLDRLDMDSWIQWHEYGHLVYGWAASEIDWQWNARESRWDPAELWHIRSRQFRIATEVYRIVPGAEPQELLVQVGLTDEQVARLIPDKWIVTRHAPYLRIARSGLLHVCARYAILRTQSWAHWFAFLRRYGIPALRVEIASWNDSLQQYQAEEMIRRWGEDVGFVVDANAKVKPEILDGAQAARSATSDPQARFVDAIRDEFTRLWTGIPTGGNSGGVGNYYTGKVTAGIRADLLSADARRLATALRNHLAEPWMRINGIRGEVPQIEIPVAERALDPETAIANVERLARIGYRPDLAQLEEITGLRLTEAPAATPPTEPEGEDADNPEGDDEPAIGDADE
jgi:phage gp29-like protein